MKIDSLLVGELEKIAEPQALLVDLHRRFGERMAIGTSGQLSGTAIVDMAFNGGIRPRVFTNDTLRLFPETYAFFDALETHYKFKLERYAPPAKELKSMVEHHGEFLFFDSKDKQEYCCDVRKVLPNKQALDSLDVWVTGLRGDQSKSRASVGRFEIFQHLQGGASRPILKVAPLASWDEKGVRDYLKANNAPVHPLLEAKLPGGFYYESLGCVLCTTPIGPHEARRAGRWRWFNSQDDKKECGLHLPVSTDNPLPPAA